MLRARQPATRTRGSIYGPVRLAPWLLVLGLASATQAQWRAEDMVAATGAGTDKMAVVEDPAGYRLEIYKDPGGVVHGAFRLRQGFEVFAEGGCPTFRVDRSRALNLSEYASPCVPLKGRTEFVLGTVQDSRIKSPILLQLMNGHEMVLRYHLADVGYRETTFELRRSKQALAEAIGADVTVSAN